MCIPISSAIFCYQCSSNTSFADCTTNQVVVQCTFPRNRCFKQHNAAEENRNVRLFYKGCIPADQCRGNNEKSVECCPDDHCNGGKFTLNYVSLSHFCASHGCYRPFVKVPKFLQSASLASKSGISRISLGSASFVLDTDEWTGPCAHVNVSIPL